MEKAVDFCFRKGKAVGETKPTERGGCNFEVGRCNRVGALDVTTNICLLFFDICI